MSEAIPLPYSSGFYTVTQGFDSSPSHDNELKWSVDFAMPYGTDVLAMMSGEIVAYRQDVDPSYITGYADASNPAYAGSGHGNYVTVKSTVNGVDLYVTYAHLAKDFLATNLGITGAEGAFSAGVSYGQVTYGSVLGQTGASGLRGTTLPDLYGNARGAHLHVHLGTDIVHFTTDNEWVADGSNDTTLPVYFDAFGVAADGTPLSPQLTSYWGSNYANYTDADDKGVQSPLDYTSFTQAALNLGGATGTEVLEDYLESVFGTNVKNVNFTGSTDAAFLVDQFTIAGAGIDHTGGIFLSSGDFPDAVNDETGHTYQHWTSGDADLDEVATAAFSGAGTTQDAVVIEFDVYVDDTDIDGIRFDLVFGSEEYSEWSDSSFVDVAAVWVDDDGDGDFEVDENKALFNGNPTTPLSVIGANLPLNFVDNETIALYPIEWDGFGAFTVRPDLNFGWNSIKIAVADTGDMSLDSGLYVTNFQFLTQGGTGNVTYKVVNGTASNNTLAATAAVEELNFFSGVGSIASTLSNLNGDIITGFDDFKTLVVQGVKLLLGQITLSPGSAILDVDADNDGISDSTITLEGDFEYAKFDVTQSGGDSSLTVKMADLTNVTKQTGSKSVEVLSGDANEDLISSGGGLVEVFVGNEGADIFEFKNLADDQTRQRVVIYDYEIGEDVISLGGTKIDSHEAVGSGYLLHLEGDVQDEILVYGVTDISDIVFVL